MKAQGNDMRWIIDLLIDNFKKEKKQDWEPEPLWIEKDVSEEFDKNIEEEEKEKRIIIIDI